ncbi:hypothetical protein [Victivallis vadensis]|uniref:hypothetical protein n=1 Tax=Victivallis vadensis TaxID=172901 RepID=UPI0023F95066|nr:hypothetical protein [Victivallis vadensis]
MSLTFLVVPALFGLLIAILVIQIRIYRGMRKLPGGEALAPLVRPGFGWKLWGGLNLLYWAVFAGSLRLSFHTFRELDIQIGQFHEGVLIAVPVFFLIAGLATLLGSERIQPKCPLWTAWVASFLAALVAGVLLVLPTCVLVERLG